MELKVVDAGCGVGKTTSIINMINEDESDNKYLYITPFLTETDRIQDECKSKNFQKPKEKPNKSEDLDRLVEKGYNIVSTHALFKRFTDRILDLTKFNDYILIVDETADVVEEIDISKDDLKTIVEEYVNIDQDGNVEWHAQDYKGRFEDYKRMIDFGGVKAYMSETREVISFIWLFPIKIFEAFKEVYILTYMFNGQKAYYEYNNVNIINYYVDKTNHLTIQPQNYNYEEQKKLITVLDNNKMNMIGETRGSLSLSWFDRNKNTILMKQLKNNLINFFINITNNTSGNQRLWSTFKEYEEFIKGKGYTKGFVPLNIRATNEYRQTTAVAYVANRFMKPTLKQFFLANNIPIDEETYALSELIQFIYRSAIRDNNPITVYIPSKRMRELFINWLNKKDE